MPRQLSRLGEKLTDAVGCLVAIVALACLLTAAFVGWVKS